MGFRISINIILRFLHNLKNIQEIFTYTFFGSQYEYFTTQQQT